MAFWEAGFGGSYGGYYRLRVNVDLLGQEEDNNRSLIRYSAWFEKTGAGTAYHAGATYGNTNINGYNPQRVINGYNFGSGTGQRYYLAQNEDYWIGHDGNGNASPYFGANYDAANSPYITSAATGGNMGLPALYRYAAPTYAEFNTITDTQFNFRVDTNRVVDNIAVSINGAAWVYFAGSTTSRTMTFSGLQSDRSHSVHISLHRQSDGYWQEHGDWYVITASQNKFFEIGDF